jgi:hypothetical protein
MSDVSIGNSPNDHCVRSIGESLSKGETPTPSAELEDYLDRSPDMVLHTLDALVQSAAEYEATDPLIFGYLTLIEWQLRAPGLYLGLKIVCQIPNSEASV